MSIYLKLILKNIYSLAFSCETNLIQKYIRSYITVTAINVPRVLPINSAARAY